MDHQYNAVTVDLDGKYLRSGKQKVKLRNVEKVSKGKVTDILKHGSGETSSECHCFSLILTNGTVDLELIDDWGVKLWVNALTLLTGPSRDTFAKMRIEWLRNRMEML